MYNRIVIDGVLYAVIGLSIFKLRMGAIDRENIYDRQDKRIFDKESVICLLFFFSAKDKHLSDQSFCHINQTNQTPINELAYNRTGQFGSLRITIGVGHALTS